MADLFQKGLFYQYGRLIIRGQQLLDGLVIFLLPVLLCQYHGIPFHPHYFHLAGVSAGLSILIFSLVNLYQPWRGVHLSRLIGRIVLSWIFVIAILALVGFAAKRTDIYSRKLLLTWMVAAPTSLIMLRWLVYRFLGWARACGFNTRSVVIAGAGDLGQQLAANILHVRALGMRILGFFDDNHQGRDIDLRDTAGTRFPILGNLDEMVEFVRQQRVDMVYLALPFRAEARIREVIHALQDTTASVYLAPDVFIFSLLQAGLTDLRGIPLISLWETPFFGVNGWLKRAEDLILGSLILVCILPVMALAAIGVKLSSPGPVIFKQRRWGLNGEEILVYKFRTMTVCEDGEEVQQASRRDKRLTSFGAFLRRTSLDELPQFFNVIMGTMSIVGPRPHAVAHNEHFRHLIPGYMLRHKVRPGITGWAQINGFRGGSELPEMEKRIEYDLDYLRRWSLWLDLKIIFYSVMLVFTDRNAY
jgi:putative colanic acid biosysnthesis UDP-glucose lipid carrier transferase